MSEIFSRARLRQSIAEIEFRYFRDRAQRAIIDRIAKFSRFGELKSEFGFRIDTSNGSDHIQINFGKRKLGVLDLEDKPAIEKGASLVYSLGRTGGIVACVLYPATSPLGSVAEDHIFLRVGTFSGQKLLSHLDSDLKDLISYTFVSSLETSPSLRDRLRFFWLRLTHPQQISGNFVRPVTPSKLLASGFRFTAASLLVAMLRPLGVLIFSLLLIYLGLNYLTPHIH
ncbi:hypothetical protein [Tardiphaga sp.]|jgi:hypothetical protein|uniref:hypothetical protein n=1 Tax=Tardiphaga sp. TaxID=1926292 RepID=UPI0037D992E5